MGYLILTKVMIVSLLIGISTGWASDRTGIRTSPHTWLVSTAESASSPEKTDELKRFQRDVRAELEQVKALIRKLESKAGVMENEDRQRLMAAAAKLESKSTAVERALKKRGMMEWPQVRRRIEAALGELEETYYWALARLHQTSSVEHYRKAVSLTEDAVKYSEIGNMPEFVGKAELAKKHAKMAQVEGVYNRHLERAIQNLDRAIAYGTNARDRTANLMVHGALWYLKQVESRPNVRIRSESQR